MQTLRGKYCRLLCSPTGITVLAAIFAFFLAALPALSAEQKGPGTGKLAAPAAPTAIPVAEIAPQATEVYKLLEDIAVKLAPSPEIETIRGSLEAIVRQIDRQFASTKNILQGQPTLATLQSEQQLWHQNQLRSTIWLKVLTGWAKQYDDALLLLADMQKTWTLTLDAAQASKAPEPVMQQIQAALASITDLHNPVQKRRSAILDLQSRVAHVVTVCGTALAMIARVQQKVVVGTFAQDSPPIWSSRLWSGTKDTLPVYTARIIDQYRADVRNYLADPSEGMPIHAGLVIGSLIVFRAARRQVRRWREAGEGESTSIMIFEHPYAAALTVSLLFISSPFSQMTATIRLLMQTLVLAPMIVLARSTIEGRLVYGIYMLGILFAVDAARQSLAAVPLVGQAILVFESLLGAAVTGVLLALEGLRFTDERKSGTPMLGGLRAAAGIAFLAFLAAFATGATGYTNLARLLAPGVLIGGTVALVFYVSVQVARGAAAFAFRVWPLRKLLMVRRNLEFIEKRIYVLFIWMAVIGWITRCLDYMGLLSSAFSAARKILAIKMQRGEVSISLGDIFLFIATIWISFLLSRLIRFVLREDVYPRMGVGRGESYAASSLIHYLIIGLGFVVAIGMLGVNLTRVTVLAGALGVGIGFGLQSVVNNFVSGLILLFERPIHVGDSIEFGDLLGEVRRIGMRTSTVHTWRGADIIVPNSQLTSEKVTNWTLSDRLRRIDLPVGVNYGAKPAKVIGILESVSAAHPNVLKYPPPQGLFTGYGDSSINFELRAWTDQFAEWPRIRSELAIAVYDAVYEAGMTFPFPQRDVHILRDHGPEGDSVPAEEGNPASTGEKQHDEETTR